MAARERDPNVHLRMAFVRDGRLTSLPRRRDLLLAACAFLVERFEPDRLYDEPEVNAILGDDAPDPATLRRLLVDHGFLGRHAGTYWRERPVPSTRADGA
jgi:ArsR family transcriptional regulator, arsenate/arsenite/antimonite-responsive transcriptional repressor